MAHYAFIDSNNVVTQVIVGREEDDLAEGIESWESYYGSRKNLTCLRTSFNTRGGVHYNTDTDEPSDDQTKALRFNYATIGYTFDPSKGTDGAFIPPQPFDSWVLDEGTCLWEAPVALPDDADTVGYYWDEEAGAWVAATEDTVE